MSQAGTVVVVGSLNVDIAARVDHLPALGETVLGHELGVGLGGKGANQAVAAARLGARSRLVGRVGSDADAAKALEALAAAGVDIALVRAVPGRTGIALVTVTGDGDNAIVVVPGANNAFAALGPADLDALDGADVLVLQLEIPGGTVRQAVLAARDRDVPVILNAAPVRPLPGDLLDAVDLLVVNEHEAAALAGTGHDQPDEAARRLSDRARRVLVTLGARGVLLAEAGEVRHRLRPPAVEVVDTTGAGDTFVGAAAVATAERRPERELLQWACAAAALSVQRPGASAAVPSRAAVDELTRRVYG
jgi:ribokinase